ncbi:hypothetical protein UFOVP683_11 [uncultured Caudovirales phage]|uniref:Uncharacterized protein n=1 Tax=uncultured Caudovirales phage TaxID=2100421 RepID=A0A6J5NC11_9CAUD|nr:hypothetical protein UFOVP683_11 [uncultured Caudovirales phage]
MSTPVGANGQDYAYPTDQETGYASQATGWATAVTAALNAIGRGDSGNINPKAVIDLSSTSQGMLVPRMTTTQISAITSPPESLLVYDTTLRVFKYYRNSAWVSLGSYVEGNFDVNGDLDVSGLGIFGSSLSALSLAITNAITAASLTLTGALNAASATLTGAFQALTGTFTSNLTVGGVTYLDDDTTANTPVISFTGDTNTGIGRSASDTLDLITGGVSRAKINSTGQQSSVIPDLSGSNTTLYNEYKCRAWVNFDGTVATPSTIRGSGNVSSIIKNGTGDYTINFSVAMPDANYAITMASKQNAANLGSFGYPASRLAGSLNFIFQNNEIPIPQNRDQSEAHIGIFR